jgi:hypothetical protein
VYGADALVRGPYAGAAKILPLVLSNRTLAPDLPLAAAAESRSNSPFNWRGFGLFLRKLCRRHRIEHAIRDRDQTAPLPTTHGDFAG